MEDMEMIETEMIETEMIGTKEKRTMPEEQLIDDAVSGSQVIEILEQLSPPCFAESWDNVGLLAGCRDQSVRKIYIALDATDEVVDAAVQCQADFLLTHHPLIFSGMKKINTDDFIGRRLVKLMANRISCYAMHTNFDVRGMAEAAARRMGLTEPEVLAVTYQDGEKKEGIGRYGQLPMEMTLAECAAYVRQKFSLDSVTVYGDRERRIRAAALCPGSGKSMVKAAVQAGADVFITGDIGHHEGLDAMAQGLAVIDAGHYGLEKLFVPYLAEYLAGHFPQLEIITSEEKNPFWISVG